VVLGNNVKIYPNVHIGDNTVIGDNTIIHAGVNIYANTRIGSYCTIHSGTVIGSDGFGFAPQADGSYKKIPQLGKVIIEDHVEIGANAVIDCATFDATIIKKGAKLDNLIQIAHNVEIGENTVIAAQAGISGSTKIGKNCVIGGQSGFAGHLIMADNTKVQAQSGVSKNTRNGQALYGSPAIDYNNYLRSYGIFRKLPEVMKQIERLEEKILNLPPD
jgi:UDP-3-O-[3-hydroxymyristoyl] glucosamine N-acyltransferase